MLEKAHKFKQHALQSAVSAPTEPKPRQKSLKTLCPVVSNMCGEFIRPDFKVIEDTIDSGDGMLLI